MRKRPERASALAAGRLYMAATVDPPAELGLEVAQ